MTTKEVLAELKSYGDERTKNTLIKHGAKEPFFGVKVQDLKKIQKKVKKDHQLSLDLYKTGNTDAMYLAGLIADENLISKKDLNSWVKGAYWHYLSEYTVPWIAAESNHGWELGNEWIESKKEGIASAGWSTLLNLSLIKPDEELDLDKLSTLLDRVEQNIHNAQNRVRYTMNGFVIGLGSSVIPLSEKAIKVASKIGKVSVNMGGTACKVPMATDYIQKCINMGRLGKKKKKARC